ncbi:MAG: arginine deiminase-related protein [Steroidobacteraceae bacterium]|nr:arginine deiminase-related protein [Steroidobacteraceae bacterium]
MSQTTDAVLMVRPAAFGWNPETASSNAFQRPDSGPTGLRQARALAEFDGLVEALASAGIRVFALDEPGPDACPDAVFPNNWVSLHQDGTVVLYPMMAPSRRRERRVELIARLEEQGGYAVERLVDLTHHELAGRVLEGTGSVVFDHVARVAYACRSPRTDEPVLRELCEELGYEPLAFDATDESGVPVYHTNVMLSIGSRSAIVCGPAIAGPQRGQLLERLRAGGRRVVDIDHAQMAAFAGNALELNSEAGTAVLALSASAWQAFGPAGRELLCDCVGAVVAPPVPTIEQLGGGSVRCMIAEVFLPRR